MDLDIAYENGAFIPEGASYPEKWKKNAQNWREIKHAIGQANLNISYGKRDRQKFDLFYPSGRPAGVVMFIHGGYWKAFDRKLWSHLAAGVTARGWIMAIPSYTLAPDARISEITGEIVAALSEISGRTSGPIVLTGHSAGGHLSARMLCKDVGLTAEVEARLKRCVPISPVADLMPITQTKMNDILKLDEAEALAESPTNCRDIRDVDVTVWVGAEERPAFLDQARWLAEAWPDAKVHVAPGRHHLDVIEELEDESSLLVNTLLSGL